jgi:benzoyl-CoA reductase/2-hydroxyglutaryl-CoA dehydratase subunit BcrC/BadD/HgdB
MTGLIPREMFEQIRRERHEEIRALRQAGRKTVGCLCIYSPVELIAAAGAVPVRLMQGGLAAAESGEKHLRADACPFCCAIAGRFESDPEYRQLDAVVAVNTCDMMRRLPESVARNFPVPVFELYMPRTSEPLPHRVAEFRGRLAKLAGELAALTGTEITEARLEQEIESFNRLRGMLRQASETRRVDNPVIGGSTLLDLAATAWLLGPEKSASLVEELLRIVFARPREGRVRPRLLLGGSMLTEDDRWLLEMIEEKADIVADLLCTGMRWFAEDAPSGGPALERLAAYYYGRDCAHRRPNAAFYNYAARVASEFRVQGLVYKTLLYCDPYSFEAKRLQQALKLPMLHLDTDYSTENREQVRTRVEAFLETL